MLRRRRNLIVLWDWSPGETKKDPKLPGRKPVALRDALGAAVLLGAIIYVLSRIPGAGQGESRARLADAICQAVGVSPEAVLCMPVSLAGWLLIIAVAGIIWNTGRRVMKAAGIGHDR